MPRAHLRRPRAGFSPSLHSPAFSQRGLAVASATLAVMAIIAVSALATPWWFILFPELAALAFELFAHPAGRWARKPLLVAVSPALTGALGMGISRVLGLSPLSVVVSVAGALLILALLRSAVTPAVSAGLLAVVLHVHTLLYPVGILYGAGVLLAGHALYVRWLARSGNGEAPAGAGAQQDGAAPPAPPDEHRTFLRGRLGRPTRVRLRDRALVYSTVLLVALIAGSVMTGTAERLTLAPPLVVLTFEACAERGCPWRTRPFRLLFACSAAATVGTALRLGIGVTPWAVLLAVGGGLGVLALLQLHVPPALAIAVLPFVMPHPTWLYPASVAAGAGLAALCYSGCRLAQRRLSDRPLPAMDRQRLAAASAQRLDR